MVVDPTAGRRHVTVTERRTKADFAEQMRRLCDEWYPEADVIRVVLDNLNTHTVGALYEAFEPAEARRLAARLEFHYTPKHASWLNMAELELSVLSRQCLSRRIPDTQTLAAEVNAWQDARNRNEVKITWCFKVADARKKMHRVYPKPTPAADH
ncbi:MAG: transposase [Gemmataceae bacterium]|nr:transposase [Gemmataceae bacterium]